MRAIIIGAGRGARLMPTTADTPKCFAKVQDKRLLDWTIEAFTAGGVTEICFIGGYQIDKVKAEYPQFVFRENSDWENNNILESLMCAEDLMEEPFICAYSDILFTSQVVKQLIADDHPITLAVDTRWEERYVHRTQHPPDDAEKVTVKNDRIERVHRAIPPADAHGEYIGVARFDAAGAISLRQAYHHARDAHAGRPFREAPVFEKAYLIHLLQEMVERQVSMSYVETPGHYIEVDTQEDFELAQTQWRGSV